MDQYRAQPKDESPAHERAEVVGGSLHDRADDTDHRPERHPEPTAVLVGARACEEAACYVADDVERGDESLVVGSDTKVGDEGINGR